MHRLFVLAWLFFFPWDSAQANDEAYPSAVAQLLEKDALSPGELRWMRGAFPGASDEEAANWREITSWLAEEQQQNTAHMRAELAALDVTPTALDIGCYGARPCTGLTIFAGLIPEFSSWEALSRAREEAQPYFETYRFAAEMTDLASAPRDEATLAEQFIAATVTEQMLRFGLSWGQGMAEGAPEISEPARLVLQRFLSLELFERDRQNLARLEQEVETNGWPTRSRVGAGGSLAAWMLVQHADSDPAFQLRSLRLMEPLVARDEVSPGNFAYLYDRVMSRITGRQRYGTQFHCVDGRREPRPLENPGEIDALRASVSLDSLEDYRALMEEAFGAGC